MEESKTCNRCFILKPLTSFFKDSNHSTGRYSICKPCKQASTQNWRENNRVRYNKMIRDYNKIHGRSIHLRANYKITIDDYNEMMLSQGNRCFICRKLNTSLKRPLAVDHNHTTGKVRGLLCYGCNRALHTLESPELLQKAMDYLLAKN